MRYVSCVIFVGLLWSCSQDQDVSFDPRVSRSVIVGRPVLHGTSRQVTFVATPVSAQ
jgi:hypothetical protein